MFRVLVADDEDAILAPDGLVGNGMDVSKLFRHSGVFAGVGWSVLGDLYLAAFT